MSLRSLSLVMGLALASAACSSTTDNPGTAGSSTAAGMSGGGVAGSSGGAGGQTAGASGSAMSGAGGSTGGAGASGGGAGGTGGMGGAMGMPTLLSQTGLFTDIKARTLAPGVLKFTPAYALWSDGATKQRYVYMPPGGKIDTSDMEFWQYPAGFKLWKDFTRDGKLIETRLLMKKSDGLTDWYMMAFRWKDDYSDADAAPMGEMNAMGTMHDVPPKEACSGCHESMHDNALGFSAFQLSKPMAADDLNLTQIASMGWLSDMPPATGFAIPGITPVEQKALGYLHANCGMCHNVHGHVYTTKSSFDAWTHLDAPALTSVQTTRAYLSLVCDTWPLHSEPAIFDNPPLAACPDGHATGARMDTDISHPKRVVPKDTANSSIIDLMTLRATGQVDMMTQMPPLATEIPDTAGGIADVGAWINGLP